MQNVKYSMDVNDSEVGLRAFLRETQRQVRPTLVCQRRLAVRRILASCMAEDIATNPEPESGFLVLR
jgi:hypothetical protein